MYVDYKSTLVYKAYIPTCHLTFLQRATPEMLFWGEYAIPIPL